MKWLILTALKMECEAIPPGEWEVKIIGIRASRFKAQMLEGFDVVILAGLGGALDPTLEVGDVLAAVGYGEWPGMPLKVGNIISSARIVSTPDAKAELYQKTGAQMVDMEHDIICKAASEQNIPMLTIRAVSDKADQGLPVEVMNWIDDVGEVKFGTLAMGLARNPMVMVELLRLSGQSKEALAKLAPAITAAVAAQTRSWTVE